MGEFASFSEVGRQERQACGRGDKIERQSEHPNSLKTATTRLDREQQKIQKCERQGQGGNEILSQPRRPDQRDSEASHQRDSQKQR